MRSFNIDEFIDLLIRSSDGLTTLSEERYIQQMISESEDARRLHEDVTNTFAMDLDALLLNSGPSPAAAPPLRKPRTRISKFMFLLINLTLIMLLTAAPLVSSTHFQRKCGIPLPATKKTAPGSPCAVGSSRIFTGDPGATVNNGHVSVQTTLIDGNKWRTVYVPKASTFKIILPDGTKAQVNADSKLRFPARFSGPKREIYLDGEAYFEVQQVPNREFVVHTKDRDVISNGDNFNIEAYDEQVNISVISGLLAVTTAREGITLQPGQAAVPGQTPDDLDITSFDQAMVLSRLEGKYLFSEKSLAEVCRLLERVYNVPVMIDRKEIAGRNFTGAISKKEPVEFFLKMLSLTDGIQYYVDKCGAWHLK